MTQVVAAGIDQSQLLRFIGYRITRTELHVHKLLGRSLAPFDLKPSEFSLLTLLASNPGMCLQELGETLDISPPNLVPVVGRLVQRALVLRQADARDRRRQHLHLTPEGALLHAAAATAVEQLEQRIEQTLSAAEKRHLATALEAVANLAWEPGH